MKFLLKWERNIYVLEFVEIEKNLLKNTQTLIKLLPWAGALGGYKTA